MGDDKKTYHNMDTPYYTDEKVRAKIDGYLIEVAALESHIGIDVKGGAKREIKSQQHEILMKIRPLD